MSTLRQLREGLNEAWEDDKGTGEEIAVPSAGSGVPAAEVFDDDNKIVVRLEALGLDKTDFDLEVLGNYLVVRGEKQIERDRTAGRYHVTERAYGRFERAIPLPDEMGTRPRPGPTTRTVCCGSSCQRRPCIVAGLSPWTCVD